MVEKDPAVLPFSQRRSLFEMHSASEIAMPLQPRRSAVVLSQTSTLVAPAAVSCGSRSIEQRTSLLATDRRPSAVTSALISPVIPKLKSELQSPRAQVLVSPLFHASIPPVIRSPLLLHQSSPQLAPQVRRRSVTDGQLQTSVPQAKGISSSSSTVNAPVVVRRSLVVPSPTLASRASPRMGVIEASSSTTQPLPIVRSPQVLSQIVMTIEAEDDLFELPPPVVDLDDEGAVLGTEDLTRTESTSSKRWHEESEDGSADGDTENGNFAQDDSMVRTPNGIHLVKAEKKYALDCAYSIWFQHAQHAKKKPKSEQQYEEGLNCVGTFKTVQDFWRYWNAIDLLKMPNFCSLSVFKHPIKPMWEDPHNKDGGQWVIRCVDRVLTADYFTKLVLALIGGYFECHEDLCGVVLTMKPKFNSIGLWNCQVEPAAVEPVLQELRELLNVQTGDNALTLEYKEHGGAIVSNSVKLGETPENGVGTAPKLTDVNLGARRLAPSWMERPARPATQPQIATTVGPAATTATVVVREAVPPTLTIAPTAPATSSSAATASGSALKATAAPFTFTAPAAATYNGYGGSRYPGSGGYQYGQNTSSSVQYDSYYAGSYAYYDSGEYNSSTTYFPASGATGEDRLWT